MWLGTYYRHLLLKKLNFDLEGEKALEIGCHDGFIISNIKARTKVGIDLKPINKYPNVDYIKSDFIDYNFDKRKFDIILSIEVMEHIEDADKFLWKLSNLISKKGKALLSVPSKNIKVFPSIFQSYIDKRWGHYYRRGFGVDELKSLLKRNIKGKKFKIIEWNCPFYRSFYIPLKFLWPILPFITKKILSLLIDLDLKFKKGKSGFFFVVVY